MKKNVVYTCITNGHDLPRKHTYINPDWDYICFTDDKTIKSDLWEIRPLEFDKLDHVKNARWHKTHPHILFPEYEKSLWIDANLDIISSNLFSLMSSGKIMTVSHFERTCIYDECNACVNCLKESREMADLHLKFLMSKKMPRNYGLCETQIMFRYHNNPLIKKIDEQWWEMIRDMSKRDQMSFTYILWKNKIKPSDISIPNERKNPINYKWSPHVADQIPVQKRKLFEKKRFSNGRRHICIFGIKVASYKRKQKKLIVHDNVTLLNNAGYKVRRSKDGIHIDGNGLHIVGESENTIWTAASVLADREYEFDPCSSEYIVIDIGLNIGLTSLWMAQKEYVKEIYSFEPFMPTMAQARHNMKLNPKLAEKIILFDFGLSNSDKALDISYNPNLPGAMSSIAGKNSGDLTERINLRNASDVLAPIFKKRDKKKVMLKIDCEGGEREILPDLASSGLLQQADVIIMEYHDNYYKPLVEIMKQAGFVVKITEQHDNGTGMIRAEKHNLLIYVTVDDKYLEFALLYPLFAITSNPDAKVEIGIVGRTAFLRLHRQYGHLLDFYGKNYPNKIFFQLIDTSRKMMPGTYRWIFPPKMRAKYVYVGDADIMITEPILDAHLENINKHNLDFSNIKRAQQEKLSGLHFMEYEKLYPMKAPLLMNLKKKCDEEFLLFMMRKKGYKIPDENKVTFRPLHGIHASWFSRAPLPTRTTCDDIVTWPSWASNTDAHIDIKPATQYLKVRYSQPITEFMQCINEGDIALRRIVQVMDMFCEYMVRNYS